MKSAGKQPHGKWKRRLVLVLCLLVLLSLGVYLGRNRFLAPFVLARLQPTIESKLGGRIQVDRFVGNWIFGLGLEGLRFERTAEEGPLVELEGATFRARYSLVALLRRGADGLESLELQADRLVVAPLSPLPGSQPDAEPKSQAPLQLPRLDVSLSELEVRFDQESILLHDVSLASRGDGLVIEAPQLAAELGSNQLKAWDLYLPLESLDSLEPSAILAGARAELEVQIVDIPQLLTRVGLGQGTLRKEVPDHALDLRLSLAENRLNLRAGSALTDGGSIDLKRGNVNFAGRAGGPNTWWQEAQLDLELIVNLQDLKASLQLLGFDNFAGSLTGDLTLGGTVNAPVGRLAAKLQAFALDDQQFGNLNLVALARGDSIEVESLEAHAAAWDLSGQGSYNLLSETFESLTLEAEFPTLGELVAEHLGVALTSGNGRLSARLSGPLSDLQGELQGRGSLDNFEFAIRAEGRANTDTDDFALELSELTLSREAQRMFLAQPARLLHEGGRTELTDLALDGDLGRLLAGAEWIETEGEGAGNIALVFEQFDPTELLGPLLPEGLEISPLEGVLRSQWTQTQGQKPSNVEAELQLTLAALRWSESGASLAIDVDASLRDKRLDLRDLRVRSQGIGSLALHGQAPLDLFGTDLFAPGDLNLDLSADSDDLSQWPAGFRSTLFGERLAVSGVLELKGNLAGSWEAVTGELDLQGKALRLEDRATGERLEPAILDLELVLGESVHLRDATLQLADWTTLRLEAELEQQLNLAALVRGDHESALAANLRAQVNASIADLSLLAGRFEAVRRMTGGLSMELAAMGPLGSPHINGKATLEQMDLRLSSAFPSLQRVQAQVSFENDRVHLQQATGELGGALFTVDGVLSGFGRGSTTPPELNMHLVGKDLLLFRDLGTRVRADTDVTVSGPLESMLVSGQVQLTEGRYGQAIDLMKGLSGEASAPSSGTGFDLSLGQKGREPDMLTGLRFDLNIGAEKPFRLDTNLVKGGLRPRLHLGGTGAVPLLDGSVFLEPTRVSLPSGQMRIDAGRVVFDKRDPFVPKLELTGGMRLKGYDLRATVSGDFDDPEVRLASTPPLPNQDLLVLFLTGQLPEKSNSARNRAAAQSVAVYLAQDYATRWLSGTEESDEESILARIDLSIGDDITRSGALTTSVSYLLTTRVIGSGRERYLTGERDVYDHINFGYGIRFRFD